MDDTPELTRYLKGRFERKRIYPVGHSQGSQLGIKMAQACPEYCDAYVGISQAVVVVRGGQIATPACVIIWKQPMTPGG